MCQEILSIQRYLCKLPRANMLCPSMAISSMKHPCPQKIVRVQDWSVMQSEPTTSRWMDQFGHVWVHRWYIKMMCQERSNSFRPTPRWSLSQTSPKSPNLSWPPWTSHTNNNNKHSVNKSRITPPWPYKVGNLYQPRAVEGTAQVATEPLRVRNSDESPCYQRQDHQSSGWSRSELLLSQGSTLWSAEMLRLSGGMLYLVWTPLLCCLLCCLGSRARSSRFSTSKDMTNQGCILNVSTSPVLPMWWFYLPQPPIGMLQGNHWFGQPNSCAPPINTRYFLMPENNYLLCFYLGILCSAVTKQRLLVVHDDAWWCMMWWTQLFSRFRLMNLKLLAKLVITLAIQYFGRTVSGPVGGSWIPSDPAPQMDLPSARSCADNTRWPLTRLSAWDRSSKAFGSKQMFIIVYLIPNNHLGIQIIKF